MSDLAPRPFRIIPADPAPAALPPPPAVHASAGFDYAGLAEKARATRTAARRRRDPGAGRRDPAQTRAAEARAGAARAEGTASACVEPVVIDAGASGGAGAGRAPEADDDDEMLAAEVAQAAWPVVHQVSRVADSFAVLLVSLAREIAAFCAVPDISRGGQWEAHVPLDERTFPHTTLHLALSPFTLSLRFDCRDPTVRQLLCDHEASLKRELLGLMAAWGEPRAIEISAW